METIAYKGRTLHVRKVDATRVSVAIETHRADGTSRFNLRTHDSIKAAKAHVTRCLNDVHGCALFENALRDTAHGVPNDYAPQNMGERMALHHAFLARMCAA